MATISHLLNQTCTISTAGVVDKFNKRTFGTATSTACRFQKVHRTLATKQNEIEPIDGLVWVESDTTVVVDDKLIFDSVDYRVVQAEPMIDGVGTTRHIELLVQEWLL